MLNLGFKEDVEQVNLFMLYFVFRYWE
jgi:hypothetical protein